MEPELIQVSVAGPAVLASVAAGIDKKTPDTAEKRNTEDPKTPAAKPEKEISDKKPD